MIDAIGLAFLLQRKILPPSDLGSNIDMVLRWIHFLAGITWIGLLYFFNLVNVPVMKVLDAPTKGKVIPVLMPKALWWFRWGAVVTVLAGFIYWVLMLHREPQPPDGTPGQYLWRTLGVWILTVGAAWAINYFLLRVPAVSKNGYILAVAVVLLSIAIFWVGGVFNAYTGTSNRTLSIGVGGGYGVFMLLNVWGVIWPAQKRIIAWTAENAEKGTPIPPESATLARRGFLASRTNFWLSFPMLFFMAAASHYPLFVGG